MTALLEKLIPAIDEAAEFIRGSRDGFSREDVEYKSFNDMVSYVDRKAEEMLRKACLELLPDSGFIGEETGSANVDNAYRWIIDPLDGTTNFVHGIPAYCISVALQYREETIVGVIQDIPRRERFTAIRGKGAFMDGKEIHVSATPRLDGGLIGTGFPYDSFGVMDDYLAVIRTLLSHCHGIRRVGAAALDLAWVACGRLDGFMEFGLQPWDVAAGALIIEEAGGRVSDFEGTDNYVFGRQIAASNGSIQEALLDLVRGKF